MTSCIWTSITCQHYESVCSLSDVMLLTVQSLMKLANKKGNEVGPEIVEDIEREQVNVVSNTQLKVCH